MPLSKENFGYYFNPKETIFDFYHLKTPELAKDFCSPIIKTNPRIFTVLVNKFSHVQNSTEINISLIYYFHPAFMFSANFKGRIF